MATPQKKSKIGIDKITIIWYNIDVIRKGEVIYMLENVVEVLDIKNECANRTTTVEVMNKITGQVFIGVAKCRPQDKYDSFVGFGIAFEKAVKDLFDTVLFDYEHGYDYMAEFLFKLNK